MGRTIAILACLFSGICLWASEEKVQTYPSFDYDVARTHEIKPHRRSIPFQGVQPGFNQVHLKLIVSPTGDVIHADASGEDKLLKKWPELQGEVYQWKFTPFEQNGKAVTAEVEEYIDLVPPERLPKKHVAPPVLGPDSKVTIALRRSGCFGSCPSYMVTVSTEGIVFNGGGYVVATGKHVDTVYPDEVRRLAKKFVDADFYSMDAMYRAGVTDNPTYVLSISIDGHSKEVVDYVGEWEGMPAIITELEDEVDSFARTQRWIKGADGLVESLQAEKADLGTVEAQTMLKEVADRGEDATLRQLLEEGVPLAPLPSAPAKKNTMGISLDSVGWLTAASSHPETLQVLIDAGASKKDQSDKDLALAGAARSGSVEAVRALIAYGANPNADLSKQTVTETSGNMTIQYEGAGSVLIHAAESGNPELVREILLYHPDVEARDRQGKTAIFALGESRDSDRDGARVECLRLLAKAGANVNAQDKDGNTPLHEIYLTDVEEELLKLGANVNARNKNGETPIFTTVDNEAIPIFIEYGADLTIRNKDGKTVVEAAEDKGPYRQEALRNAIQAAKQR